MYYSANDIKGPVVDMVVVVGCSEGAVALGGDDDVAKPGSCHIDAHGPVALGGDDDVDDCNSPHCSYFHHYNCYHYHSLYFHLLDAVTIVYCHPRMKVRQLKPKQEVVVKNTAVAISLTLFPLEVVFHP